MEHNQANGGAEQRVRALRERFHIIMEDEEVMFDRPAAQWAVRHAEWIQNFLVESDVSLSGGGTFKMTLMKNASLGAKSNDRQQKNLIGWSLGHHDAFIITYLQDRCVKYSGSWKYSPTHNNNEHAVEN